MAAGEACEVLDKGAHLFGELRELCAVEPLQVVGAVYRLKYAHLALLAASLFATECVGDCSLDDAGVPGPMSQSCPTSGIVWIA